MNRFPLLASFLMMFAFASGDGFEIKVMSNCSAHGLRPQSSTVFCRACGEMHDHDTEICGCGSDDLLAMCDLCEDHFRTNGGRVPVESAN